MLQSPVEDRIARVVSVFCPPAELADLVRRIVRTIQAGDDIGNGLRAIPIAALEELSNVLKETDTASVSLRRESASSV